jgi:hypothetical protein
MSVDAADYRGRRWRTASPIAVCLFGGSERSPKRAHAARVPSFSLLSGCRARASRLSCPFAFVPSPDSEMRRPELAWHSKWAGGGTLILICWATVSEVRFWHTGCT